MFLTELFEDNASHHVTIDELKGVPEKALSILSRLARFHQVSDLAFDRKAKVWTANDSDGLAPFVRDAKHITSAANIGKRMASESMNEAYLSAAEAKFNPGVEVGNHVCIKDPSKPHSLQYAKLLRIGRSGLAIVLGNNGEKFSVPPSWVFASTEDAWPQPKFIKKPAPIVRPEGTIDEGQGYVIDNDDLDEFSQEECARIQKSHFPDTLRSNLRLKHQQDKELARRATWTNDGGESNLGSPLGGSSSNNDY